MIVRNSITMNISSYIPKRGVMSNDVVLSVHGFDWLINLTPNLMTRKINNTVISGIMANIPYPNTTSILLPGGILCCRGKPINVEPISTNLPIHSDIYVDVAPTGIYNLTPVIRGCASPSVESGMLRTQIITTTSKGIEDVKQMYFNSLNAIGPLVDVTNMTKNFTLKLNQQLIYAFVNTQEINIPINVNPNQLYGITIVPNIPCNLSININDTSAIIGMSDQFTPYYSFISTIPNSIINAVYIKTLKDMNNIPGQLNVTDISNLGTINSNVPITGFVLVTLLSIKTQTYTPPVPIEYFFS